MAKRKTHDQKMFELNDKLCRAKFRLEKLAVRLAKMSKEKAVERLISHSNIERVGRNTAGYTNYDGSLGDWDQTLCDYVYLEFYETLCGRIDICEHDDKVAISVWCYVKENSKEEVVEVKNADNLRQAIRSLTKEIKLESGKTIKQSHSLK